jgi:transposase-like protein
VRVERGTANGTAEKKSVLNLTDQTELIRLRKENERLRMEREILKKAAVFPSTSSGQALRKKSNKVRVYSRATEDVSGYRVMSSHAGQYQRFLCVDPSD